MGNVVPSAWPLPDPASFAPGRAVLANDAQRLLAASNYIMAMPVSPLAAQQWDSVDGGTSPDLPIFAVDAAAYVDSVAFDVPQVDQRTKIGCCVYAWSIGGGSSGSIRFQNSAGAHLDLAVTTTPQWLVGDLDAAYTSGVDTILVRTQANGGGTVYVLSVHLDSPPLDSPLDPADDTVLLPFDEDELQAGEPWSADILQALLANEEAFLARQRVWASWSGLTHTVDGTKASKYMPPWLHRWLMPVWPGTASMNNHLRFRIHAYNADPTYDADLWAAYGGRALGVDSGGGDGSVRKVPHWTVPASTTDTLYESTNEAVPVESPGVFVDVPYLFGWIAAYPYFATNNAPPIDGTPRSSATITRFTAWGQ